MATSGLEFEFLGGKLEQIINLMVGEHLEKKVLVISWFIKNRSFQTTLRSFFDKITKLVDERNAIDNTRF